MARFFSPVTDPLLFACPCGSCLVKPKLELVILLDAMREKAGRPVRVTSGPRCPAHNTAVGGREGSAHLTGDAVDLNVGSSHERFALLRAALAVGFERVGIGKNFLHVDISTRHAPMVCWLYED